MREGMGARLRFDPGRYEIEPGSVMPRGALTDEEWLAAHAEGWPELRERLGGWSAERAAVICGTKISCSLMCL